MYYPSIFLNATSFLWKCHQGCPDWMLLLVRKVWLPYGKTQATTSQTRLVPGLFPGPQQAEGKSPEGFKQVLASPKAYTKLCVTKGKRKTQGKNAVLLESLCLDFILVSGTFSFKSYYAIFQSVWKNVGFSMKKKKKRHFAGFFFFWWSLLKIFSTSSAAAGAEAPVLPCHPAEVVPRASQHRGGNEQGSMPKHRDWLRWAPARGLCSDSARQPFPAACCRISACGKTRRASSQGHRDLAGGELPRDQV